MDKHRFIGKLMLEKDFCHVYHECTGLTFRVQWPFVFPEGL